MLDLLKLGIKRVTNIIYSQLLECATKTAAGTMCIQLYVYSLLAQNWVFLQYITTIPSLDIDTYCM
jgi:hypothetical protein